MSGFPTFAEASASLSTYRKPSAAGQAAHRGASETLWHLAACLREVVAAPTSGATFTTISSTILEAGAEIAPLLPVAKPSATEAARALNRVRMCATRAAGAMSAVADSAGWRLQLDAALCDLELAVATAITDQPGMVQDAAPPVSPVGEAPPSAAAPVLPVSLAGLRPV